MAHTAFPDGKSIMVIASNEGLRLREFYLPFWFDSSFCYLLICDIFLHEFLQKVRQVLNHNKEDPFLLHFWVSIRDFFTNIK